MRAVMTGFVRWEGRRRKQTCVRVTWHLLKYFRLSTVWMWMPFFVAALAADERSREWNGYGSTGKGKERKSERKTSEKQELRERERECNRHLLLHFFFIVFLSCERWTSALVKQADCDEESWELEDARKKRKNPEKTRVLLSCVPERERETVRIACLSVCVAPVFLSASLLSHQSSESVWVEEEDSECVCV